MPKKRSPIDPLDGPKLALAGRVVTMNDAFDVLDRATVYVEKGGIVAVAPAGAPPPAGFEQVSVIDTGGTIYPGLIELHNHLSYDALRLWAVPKAYGNRNQWAGTPDYQRLVSGPMGVLGRLPGALPAVVRYVECKCLVGGVTTSQGIEIFSNHGARRYYRGIVRNVEQTGDADLPEAGTRIADVEASDAAAFLARLGQRKCFLLHLSEGVDAKARQHFLSLQMDAGRWAIADSLAGIHCTALERADFDVMAGRGASMVWSPLSNLLLYGGTARIEDAKDAGMRIGIGSDWSPTGSKSLFGELKVAKLVSDDAGGVFSDREILSMATRNAAAILRWDHALGSLEAGKRADLFVLSGSGGDPYRSLLTAAETAIRLVMINGVARFGAVPLMTALGADDERVTIGSAPRTLHLRQKTADPDVDPMSLAEARASLTKMLHDLGKPAARRRAAAAPLMASRPSAALTWYLALDELSDTGLTVRPNLSYRGVRPMAAAKGRPVTRSVAIPPLDLDPMTVADDSTFLQRLAAEKNLPGFVKNRLAGLFTPAEG